jgi:hypothetical protein
MGFYAVMGIICNSQPKNAIIIHPELDLSMNYSHHLYHLIVNQIKNWATCLFIQFNGIVIIAMAFQVTKFNPSLKF